MVYSPHSSSVHIYFCVLVTNKVYTANNCIKTVSKTSVPGNLISRTCFFRSNTFCNDFPVPFVMYVFAVLLVNVKRELDKSIMFLVWRDLFLCTCRGQTKQSEQEDQHGRLKVGNAFGKCNNWNTFF